ncbi:MAG: hypothetical protein AUK35_02285 [Zetaproteobacteria bacterium CG2_30_46_52]|nr:MAG: hypothetical protein AUK35_02285 [Zetaproteobacteria bacterium CG2_30_46_52]
MKVKMLVNLKHYVLVKLMRSFAKGHQQQKLPEQVYHIALWQLGGVGDMLLATPVIEALHKKYPNAQIDVWCSHPQFAEFLTRFPNVYIKPAFSVYDFDARTLWKKETRQSLASLLAVMSVQPYDILVNLHVPALLDWWAVEWWLQGQLKPKFTIGFHPDFLGERSLHDVSIAGCERKNMHYTRLYQSLLNKAGMACDSDTSFPISTEEKAKISALLKAAGIQYGKPIACMHIGGRRLLVEQKMWPIASFAEVAKYLLGQGYAVVLIGVSSEAEMGQALMVQVDGVVSLIGLTSLGEMAAMIQASALFIGHDSGPFHIAVACDTPAVCLCGRPDAEPEYLQYEQDNVVVLTGDSPEKIRVQQVLEAVLQVGGHAKSV